MLDTETAKNCAATHTNDPLHIYATIGGFEVGEKWVEGIAAMAGVARGRAGDVLVF